MSLTVEKETTQPVNEQKCELTRNEGQSKMTSSVKQPTTQVRTIMTTTTKTISKMDQARAIFAEIYTEGYKLPEGKQARGHFIDRCMTELGLTKLGAGTYHYNINGFVNKGKKLYAHSGKKKDQQVTSFVDVSAAFGQQTEQEALFDVNEEVEQESHRWMVMKDGEELTSFAARAKAQEFAKMNDCEWADRQKVVA